MGIKDTKVIKGIKVIKVYSNVWFIQFGLNQLTLMISQLR